LKKNKIISLIIGIVSVFTLGLSFVAGNISKKTSLEIKETNVKVEAEWTAKDQDDSLKGGSIYLKANTKFTMM